MPRRCAVESHSCRKYNKQNFSDAPGLVSGEVLIVTSGVGWVQSEGPPKLEIRPGDVVWCPPNEKHWHGATPTSAMTHLAIQASLDGKVVEWLEKVSNEQYEA